MLQIPEQLVKELIELLEEADLTLISMDDDEYWLRKKLHDMKHRIEENVKNADSSSNS